MADSGIPSFRGIAHMLSFDPGLYYETQHGCVAYIGGNRMPYKCCNDKIEDFDLQASRNALLKVLAVSSNGNVEYFVRTLQCRRHRKESGTSLEKTTNQWWSEISCKADNHSSCSTCSLLKPRPRWDAGFKYQFVSPQQKSSSTQQVSNQSLVHVNLPPMPASPAADLGGTPVRSDHEDCDGTKAASQCCEPQYGDAFVNTVASSSKASDTMRMSATMVVIPLVMSVTAFILGQWMANGSCP